MIDRLYILMFITKIDKKSASLLPNSGSSGIFEVQGRCSLRVMTPGKGHVLTQISLAILSILKKGWIDSEERPAQVPNHSTLVKNLKFLACKTVKLWNVCPGERISKIWGIFGAFHTPNQLHEITSFR